MPINVNGLDILHLAIRNSSQDAVDLLKKKIARMKEFLNY